MLQIHYEFVPEIEAAPQTKTGERAVITCRLSFRQRLAWFLYTRTGYPSWRLVREGPRRLRAPMRAELSLGCAEEDQICNEESYA
jgi:hypothetical protein